MRAYVASRLENAAVVRQAHELLRAVGHEITYDWAMHGPVCWLVDMRDGAWGGPTSIGRASTAIEFPPRLIPVESP